MTSFFRYPGGKAKLQQKIIPKLGNIANLEYREPFFGGGSIGIAVLDQRPASVWINDFDDGIAALWQSVIYYPALLKEQIRQLKPSVAAFDQIKSELSSKVPSCDSADQIANFGLKKLAIHQLSYSGLGTKAGGPLGGKHQRSKYKIDSRWSPNYMCAQIDLIHAKFAGLEVCCTSVDFMALIEDTSRRAIVFLDPPYWEKGSSLYQHAFSDADHQRLADALRVTEHHWVLTYDDCPQIRALYNWATIEVLEVKYSIAGSHTKNELLITA